MTSYSLSELLDAVRQALKITMGETYWVRAELSSLNARPGSHCYMELAESGDQQGLFAAKVRANCWRNVWQVLSAEFEDATGQPLRVGMQVLVEVSVDFHPVYGISLTVLSIDPSFTMGDLARRKQEALRRLTEDGVLEMQKSLSLPTLPQRIAVISASSAAGYQDFVHQLETNPYGYCFRTTLYQALMQGDRAAESIIAALEEIYNANTMFSPKDDRRMYDAVVIIRGGGATTDLSCFDQYELASHCAQFPLPIIAGIGHTRDVSLVDMVAFESVKTPTAAAELLIKKMADQDQLLTELEVRIRQTAVRQVRIRRLLLDNTAMQVQMALRGYVEKRRTELQLLEKTTELASPERIFKKGYSLTERNGEVVRDAATLQPGDVIRTHLAEGVVESEVK